MPPPSGRAKYASIVIGMGDVSTVALTETQNYPLSACISDIGGAAGLFLGLHVLGMLNTIDRFLTGLVKRIRYGRKIVIETAF